MHFDRLNPISEQRSVLAYHTCGSPVRSYKAATRCCEAPRLPVWRQTSTEPYWPMSFGVWAWPYWQP